MKYNIIKSSNFGSEQLPKCKEYKKLENKPVVNEIFLEYKKSCDDPFWQEIFLEFAHGIYQKNLYINNNYIIHKKNNLKELPSDPEDWKIVANIISNITDLKSAMDTKNNENEGDKNTYKHFSLINDWEEISNNKTYREFVLDNYIYELSKKYKLKKEDSKELKRIINFCIRLGFIGKKDIFLNKGRIKKISGLKEKDNKIVCSAMEKFTESYDYKKLLPREPKNIKNQISYFQLQQNTPLDIDKYFVPKDKKK